MSVKFGTEVIREAKTVQSALFETIEPLFCESTLYSCLQ